MIGDGAYKSLLQGVSQQVLHLRKDGQLTSQTNMLADAVTGLRRRPGVLSKSQLVTGNAAPNKIMSYYSEYDGKGYHVIINCKEGSIKIFDTSFVFVDSTTNSYLIAPDISSIRTTTVAGYTWLANTTVTPDLGTSNANKRNPDFDGWFSILLGAYSKKYSVRVQSPGFSEEYSYTTPDGTTAGDPDLATPTYIADQIKAAMLADSNFTAKFDVSTESTNSVSITRAAKDTTAGSTEVTHTAGLIYALSSNNNNVATRDLLPANLPALSNNMIMSVGSTSTALTYFKWDDARSLWVEVSAYGSADTLINMPLRFTVVSDNIELNAPTYEGRLSGDENNNPYPAFLDLGITGISAYQGRLVILSGGYANMSASNRPLRFMRSTALTLNNDDAIEISAGALVNTNFEYAVPFNKDLVLVSKTHQAVIPAGSSGITPFNAMVLLSSNTAISTVSEPKVVGRTIMYSTDISTEFFGVGEIIPSQYSDSQYSTQNLTEHIPRYIAGQCRSIVSSSSSNIALFLSDTATNEVLVNEYLWVGDERIQNAWHKWEFATDVYSMHFVQGQIIVLLQDPIGYSIGVIDPRAASYQQSGTVPPFLDNYSVITVTDNKFILPSRLRDLALLDKVALAHVTGELTGDPIGIDNINTSTWEVTTVRSFSNGAAGVGLTYSSSFAPSSPLFRDKEDLPILTANANVMRYVISVRNTGEFFVEVDIKGVNNLDLASSAIKWSSYELGLNSKQAVDFGKVIVPVRASSDTSVVTCIADSTRELNPINIEYTIRGVRKRQRV